MQLIVTFNIPDEIGNNLREEEINLLLRDAFHDFIRERGSVKQYVGNRYPTWSTERQKLKVVEVTRRLNIIISMRDGEMVVKIEE